MEAAEDSSLEPAIGWLAQTILETLLMDKLDAWIRQAGLADAIESLKSEVERVEMVVAAVRGRATGNKPLSRSLARLKDLLYDADDVVDELDYYRLQQQVEGVVDDDPQSTHGAEAERADETSRGTAAAADIPNGSGGNLRSKHWKDFTVITWESGKAVEAKCNLCGAHPIKCGSGNGTSVLSNHIKSKGCIRRRGGPPNPSSTDDATEIARPVVIGDSSSRKRKRADDESSEITATNTDTPWDKAELSNRIPKLTSQLQDIRGKVSEVLKLHGPDFPSSSNNHRSAASDQQRTTSSLAPRKVYGRVAEKNAIIKMIMEDKSNGVKILPIVGIAGVGKTTLAQLVYNDPDVESQFDTKIWVWVSHNFDEVRLTREMLDFVPHDIHEGPLHRNERHEGISSFAKLQEILKQRMEYQSKRFLLILDDIWDNLDDKRWNKLLNPLISSQLKGNVILVTTRNLCVAQKKGTVEPIELCALADEDFWLLFKSRAFGDENYKGDQCLSIIGRQIAEKLKGNPLAAETAGELLRENITIDHWTNILKYEYWKSLQLSTGIMPALKLSYDQLPDHLQQCFSYTSIFPSTYRFLGEELVRIWISQGFVRCNHASKTWEEIGWNYLNDLVNLGFFQQVEREEPSPSSETCYAMCGLVHDFARMVSSTECVIIDGLQCNKMPQTIRHLSIVTDSVYNKDQHGNIPRDERFEENLKHTVTLTSVRKLRTLLLIGQYDSSFFISLCDIFQNTQHLRLLQISAPSDDSSSFLRSLVNHTHLRYLKLKPAKVDRALPRVLIKFFHLQVLDVGSNTDITVPNGMHSLLSLRHLVAEKGVYSSIASTGSMTSLQERHDFNVQTTNGFETTQLESMNNLVQLGVPQLDDVRTREEAYGARMRNKDTSSQELLRTDESGPSCDPSMDRTIELLLGLEPHQGVKRLQISGHCDSPTWLAADTSVTTLQKLRLYYCGKWQILPSLEIFPFLRKLELSNLLRVTEDAPAENCMAFPSLQSLTVGGSEIAGSWLSLMLTHAPNLEILIIEDCTNITLLSVQEEENSLSNLISPMEAQDELLNIPFNLMSRIKVITIENCPRLRFNGSKKGFSGFTSLEKLNIWECPELLLSLVRKDGSDDQANGRWLLPASLGELDITEYYQESLHPFFPSNLTSLKKLEFSMADLKSLELHSCTALEELTIRYCKSLSVVEGLQSLGSLRDLTVCDCPCLPSYLESFSRQCHELLPRLETLVVEDSDILTTSFCKHLTSLHSLQLRCWMGVTRLTEEQERALVLLKSLRELSFYDCHDLVHLPAGLHTLPSLKRLKIDYCSDISRLPETGLPVSLEELELKYCREDLNDQCMLLATSKLNVKIIP